MHLISRFLGKRRLYSCLTILLLSPLGVGADTILSLPKDGPFSPDFWKPSTHPNVSMKDGVLHIVSDTEHSDQFSVNYIYNANPLDGLNFLHHAVQIKLEDLDIKGDADPSKQVFCLFLINDAPLESPQSSLLKIRFSPEGTLYITINAPGGASQQLWHGPVKLPIKSMTVSLNPTGAKFDLEDANGAQSQEAAWTTAVSMSGWENATPYLRVQGQRAPTSGSSEVTLGAITVDSTSVSTPTAAPTTPKP